MKHRFPRVHRSLIIQRPTAQHCSRIVAYCSLCSSGMDPPGSGADLGTATGYEQRRLARVHVPWTRLEAYFTEPPPPLPTWGPQPSSVAQYRQQRLNALRASPQVLAPPFVRCQCRKDEDELGEKKSALPHAKIKFVMHVTRVQHAKCNEKTATRWVRLREPRK